MEDAVQKRKRMKSARRCQSLGADPGATIQVDWRFDTESPRKQILNILRVESQDPL